MVCDQSSSRLLSESEALAGIGGTGWSVRKSEQLTLKQYCSSAPTASEKHGLTESADYAEEKSTTAHQIPKPTDTRTDTDSSNSEPCINTPIELRARSRFATVDVKRTAYSGGPNCAWL